MRVLQLHTRYRRQGGEDVVVDAEADVLRKAGHEVRQVIDNNPEKSIHAAGSLLINPWNPHAMRRVAKAIAEYEPDIAHVHNTWFASSPAIIRTIAKAGVPVALTLHNYRLACANAELYRDGAPCELCVGTHPWHGVRYSCYRESKLESLIAATTIDLHQRLQTWSKCVTTFVALTEFQRDLMIRAGLPGAKIVVKPHFVNDPGPRGDRPSASNRILFVGRLSQPKGIHTLNEAWRTAGLSGYELWLVGEGPGSDIFSETPGVRLLGHRPRNEVTDLMLSSRALVMPSEWYEPMGLVLLEALASGLPTTVTELGAPGEIVRPSLGEDWVFEAGSVKSLASAFKRITDDKFCDEGGDAARRAFESCFTEARGTHQLLGLYEDMLSGPPGNLAHDGGAR